MPTAQLAMRHRRIVLRSAFFRRTPTADPFAPSPETRMFSTTGPTRGVPAELSIRMPTWLPAGATSTSPRPITETRLDGPMSAKGEYEPGATQITPSEGPRAATADAICLFALAQVFPSLASLPVMDT